MLEIVNLGPFTFVLQEDDVIAQLTVATISSSPQQTHAGGGILHLRSSSSLGQTATRGAAEKKRK